MYPALVGRAGHVHRSVGCTYVRGLVVGRTLRWGRLVDTGVAHGLAGAGYGGREGDGDGVGAGRWVS